MRRLRILTWHVHGSYLYYLSRLPHDLYVLSKPDRPPGYTGRWGHFPWPENLHDMPVAKVREHEFDCILFQAKRHYLEDQHELLTPAQRRLPTLYLEHDPPQEHPTNTRHFVRHDTLLVHVTPFNALMWDSGKTPSCVVEHGVVIPDEVRYDGALARGIVVVNHLRKRGRRLGHDVFEAARQSVPLDLVGLGAEECNGLGEIRHDRLPAFQSHYRFFFNPIRYTSLGLAMCEAMMIGMPIIGLATTEMATLVRTGVTGYVDTSLARLVEHMQRLLDDPAEAHELGRGARRDAEERFNIGRFVADWQRALQLAVS
jgi:glycosyltransferase involved in cell wall biosynthesis